MSNSQASLYFSLISHIYIAASAPVWVSLPLGVLCLGIAGFLAYSRPASQEKANG